MKRQQFYFAVLFATIGFALAAEPQRSAGLSVHMLPKRVASISKQKAGFTISQQGGTKPPKNTETKETAEALLEYFRSLSKDVLENGIWVVTTDPEAYSAGEAKNLAKLKDICTKEKIPLFTCRGAELPDGWKREDK